MLRLSDQSFINAFVKHNGLDFMMDLLTFSIEENDLEVTFSVCKAISCFFTNSKGVESIIKSEIGAP